MSTTVFQGPVWDRLGIFLSLGCALHCLVMALLPSLMASQTDSCCHDAGEGWTFHSVALVLVLIVATLACFRCCARTNVLKLMVGLGLLWSAQSFEVLLPYETPVTVVGAFLLGWAHWANLANPSRPRQTEND